jgi:hypothetical protein
MSEESMSGLGGDKPVWMTPNPETVTVQVMEGEDGEAVWVELCESPEPGMWLATLPTAELDEFHAAHEAMGRVIAAAVESSPRGMDGEWRVPCDSFEEGFASEAEHYWQVRWDGSHAVWKRFESEQDARDALARIQSYGGVVVIHGRMGGDELFSVLDTSDWYVDEVDRPAEPVGTACQTCWFDRAEHTTSAGGGS